MWGETRKVVYKVNDPPEFVAYDAYEWSGTTDVGGDHNVYYKNQPRAVPFLPSSTVRPVPNVWKVLDFITGSDIESFTIPHVGGRVGNWDYHDPVYQRAGEITSDHGIFEWFLLDAWNRGYKVAAVGGSDGHQGRPGYSPVGNFWNVRGGLTAVYGKDLTNDGVWEGLWNKRCYATSQHQRIILSFRVSNAFMGEEINSLKNPVIKVRIAGEKPLLKADIIRNGEIIYTKPFALKKGASGKEIVRVVWNEEGEPGIGRGQKIYYEPQQGYITISSGRISSAEMVNFEVPKESLDNIQPDRVDFTYSANGYDKDGILLGFDGDLNATFSLVLAQARYSFTYSDLAAEGELVLGEEGRATATILNDNLIMDTEFSYTDMNPTSGDNYYYVRISQVDGNLAWSTPVWVKQR